LQIFASVSTSIGNRSTLECGGDSKALSISDDPQYFLCCDFIKMPTAGSSICQWSWVGGCVDALAVFRRMLLILDWKKLTQEPQLPQRNGASAAHV